MISNNSAQLILNILIACEESQAETIAFRNLGHNAFSCDIQPCRPGGHPEWHIHGDASPYLQGVTKFTTADGQRYDVKKWHLIIAHPPCTYLCKVSSVKLHKDPDRWIITPCGVRYLNKSRWEHLLDARKFFLLCLNAKADYVAVENPIPMAIADLPRPSFYACPSWFGIKYTKKTLYWVKNLPPLMPNFIYPNAKCFVTHSRGKYRSRTFPQMAKAIAEQWTQYILCEMSTGSRAT